MATIETALTRLLGIQHPILLAPMGSAAGGKLAAAVTHAGGLGMVGSGYADDKAIRRELGEAGNARVGIGFILWALDKNPAALEVALDAKPAAVMLSFGDPSPYTRRISGRAAGSSFRCRRSSRPSKRPRRGRTRSSRRDAMRAGTRGRRGEPSGWCRR